jgi:hypothetical protein
MKKIFKMMFDPENKDSIPDDQTAIDYLLIKGGLEVAGIDSKTGEFLYVFTPKIKEIMPELYHEHMNHVNNEIMGLWEKGFVNIDLMSENPIVTLTQKALDIEEVSKLDPKDQWSIEEIKRLLKHREL